MLSFKRDDGIVIYVNGHEAVRDNMPSGIIDATTTAEIALSGSKERAWQEILLPVESLTIGENLVAAEVHQASPSSSDLRFALEAKLLNTPDLPVIAPPFGTDFENGQDNDPFFVADEFAGGVLFLPIVRHGILEGEPLKSAQIGFFDSVATLESVPMTIIGHSDVRISLDLRTEGRDEKLPPSSSFTAELKVSQHGIRFETLPWLEMKGGGTTPIEWTELVNGDSLKKARVPSSAVDPSSNWHDLDFDDSDWQSGKEGIGYEVGSGFEDLIGIDILETMRNVNGAVYARIPFEFSAASEFTSLQLRMKYDDGYVVYLNGTEVHRQNAPDQLRWNSAATAPNNDSRAVIFEDVDLTPHLSLLTYGVRIEPEQPGDVTVASVALFETFESSEEPALFFIEQAVEEDDGCVQLLGLRLARHCLAALGGSLFSSV